MSTRYRVTVPSNTAHLAKRLAQPFSKQKLLHAARMMGATLVALTFAGVAHAQGTMDFSGATTLMTTFNVSSPTIQSKVEFSNPVQIISKQPVSAFDRQREHIRDLKQHAQCGMVPGTTQVREQVLRDQLATFEGIALAVVRRHHLPMDLAEMSKSRKNLSAGNVSIHS